MIIQIIIVVAVIFIMTRAYRLVKMQEITQREFLLWLGFWALVAVVAVWPKQTDPIAQFLGVERGADLLVYLSIITLFFICFKLIVKLECVDRNTTKLVRFLAQHEAQTKDAADSLAKSHDNT
jgi:hypothetical protein